MPDAAKSTETVIQIQASASLMTFDAGLFCIFLNAPILNRVTPGYPAIKVSQAPNMPPGLVTISTLDEENFISGAGGAALVRVNRGPAQVLVTTYRIPDDTTELPGVQVARLGGPPGVMQSENGQTAPGALGLAATDAVPSEITAHIRQRGDVSGGFGSWIGQPGSKKWIEGFSLTPAETLLPEDIEYQAMLGKGWLSPWVDGGAFCGSRGMALPILGLRVRLKEAARGKARIIVEASFTDGSTVSETDADAVISAESHAPLEAFQFKILPAQSAPSKKTSKA